MYRIKEIESRGLKLACIIKKEDNVIKKNRNEHLLNILKNNHIYPTNIIHVKQEHTNIIEIIDKDYSPFMDNIELPVADGMITEIPDVALCISVADCVPVIIFDSNRKVLGVIHAGREGTRKQITYRTVNILKKKFLSNPEDIICYIGPSIGPCCYVVSTEIAKQCEEDGLVVRGGNIIDLWESNKIQIIGSGIKENQILLSNICTCCNTEYYSYRRGDKEFRNYVIAMI